MFGPLAKWVAQIDSVDRIPELVARAFTTAVRRPARAGRARAARGHARRRSRTPPTRRRSASCSRIPAPADLESLRGAARPAPSARSRSSAAPAGRRGASDDMRAFLEANELPAGAAFRRQDTLDNDSPSYVGDVGIGDQPGARGAGPRRRPAARRRAAARRDDDVRLHAPRRAAAAADARARPSRRRGARPRLPGRAADPLGHGRSSPRAVRDAARRAALARGAARRRAPTTRPGSEHQPMPGRVDLGDVHRAPPRARAATRS